jgi:hypothetical protein
MEEEWRAALASAVMREGLRSIARDVGLSPTGLQGIIHGRPVRRQTLWKIEAWFAGQRPPDFAAALDVVVAAAPPERRSELRNTILALVGRPPRAERTHAVYRTCPECMRRVTAPRWDEHMRQHRSGRSTDMH